MSQNPIYAQHKERKHPGRDISDPKRRGPSAADKEAARQAVLGAVRTGTPVALAA